MKEASKIREITLTIREMISSGELDSSHRKRLWDRLRELEGLMKKFQSNGTSNINRKALRSALVALATDLLDAMRSKERK